MKTSKVLRQVVKKLPMDYRCGICRVIATCSKDAPIKDLSRIQNIIGERLGEWAWATDWLAHAVLYPKVPYGQLDYSQIRLIYKWSHNQSAKHLQEWRRAWLDRMIVEFEAKGD